MFKVMVEGAEIEMDSKVMVKVKFNVTIIISGNMTTLALTTQ
jgi:hypothetical protein